MELTKDDWVEIYYALDTKRFTEPVCCDLEWDKHLVSIMEKIGVEGINMWFEEVGNGKK